MSNFRALVNRLEKLAGLASGLIQSRIARKAAVRVGFPPGCLRDLPSDASDFERRLHAELTAMDSTIPQV